jgi:uncharacterized repeat protein (TIGR01451 family)
VKSAQAAHIDEGSNVTYTIVLHNGGAFTQGDNPGDEFTDVLPSSLLLLSASATSGTALADAGTNTVHWNGSIAARGDVTITIQATIRTGTAGSTVSNQGTIHFDGDGNGTNESTTTTSTAQFAVVSTAKIPTLSPELLFALAALLGAAAWIAIGRGLK